MKMLKITTCFFRAIASVEAIQSCRTQFTFTTTNPCCHRKIALHETFTLQYPSYSSRAQASSASHACHEFSNPTKTLPVVGLGVYLSEPGVETYNAVLSALKMGYRHIDTAQYYKNEEDVGRAVKDSGVPREGVSVTTKLFIQHWVYQKAIEATKANNAKL
jgi:hypothetical protein